MGVHMVGAVLRVIFEDEDRGVVPVRAVRYGFHYATHCEVVIGD